MQDTRLGEDRRWHQVSLRFYGDGLPDPASIEEATGLLTSHSGVKGKHIGDNPRYAKYPTTLWVAAFTTDNRVPFEEQIAALLALLEPRADAVSALLADPAIDGELFLGYGSESGQGGASLSAPLVARIVALGLALTLDLYPPGEQGEPADSL